MSAKYWRLYIDENHGSTSYTALNEIEMYGTEGGQNLCIGGSATGSIYHGSYDPSKAFDGDITTNTNGWLAQESTNVWIQYTFTEPVIITHFSLRSITPSLTSLNSSPKRFRLESSLDGIEWQEGITYDVPVWGTHERRDYESGFIHEIHLVSGKVVDRNGIPLNRLIYLHAQHDYSLIGSGYTDSIGNYDIYTNYPYPVMVRIVDESGIYNSVIRENVIPVEIPTG